MSPVSRRRSGKGKGSGRGAGSGKAAARSGNPQVRAAAALEQAERSEQRRQVTRSESPAEELRRLRRERQRLIVERDELRREVFGLLRSGLAAWYQEHATELIVAAEELTAAPDPAALEQAAAELVADRLVAMRDEQPSDWEVVDWLEAVAAAAIDDHGEASWFLLHGLAAICPPGPAAAIRHAIDERRKTAPTSPTSPTWLPLTPQLTVEAAVEVFTDAYGLRSAVLVPARRPGGPARTYLLDVDLCPGYPSIVRSGWYPDPDTAVTAWAHAVGPSAAADGSGRLLLARVTGTALGPAAARASSAAVDVLGELLPLLEDPDDVLLGEDDPHERAVALLRDRRIINDLTTALTAFGADPADRTPGDYERAAQWAEQEAPRFRTWRETHATPAGRQAPTDLVEDLLTEWAAYTPPRLFHACSPHRVVSFAAQLAEEWADRGRLRIAWSLVAPWAEYCIERSGLPEHLAIPVRDAAQTLTRAPEQTAARAVDTWKTPTDETHPFDPDA